MDISRKPFPRAVEGGTELVFSNEEWHSQYEDLHGANQAVNGPS
jgi:hypothetical protein